MAGHRAIRRLVAVVAFVLAGPLGGAGFREMPLDEVFRKGHEVFVGKVLRTEARWDAQRKMIWTSVTFDVVDVWSGEKTGQKTLRVAGGTVDGKTIVVTHTPRFETGETYVVSAHDPAHHYASPVVGTEQGYFRQVTEEASGRMILVDGDGRCLERAPSGALFRGRLTSPGAAPSFVRFLPAGAEAPAIGDGAPPKIEAPVYRDAEGRVVKTPRSAMKPKPSKTFVLRGEPLELEALREFARDARSAPPVR